MDYKKIILDGISDQRLKLVEDEYPGLIDTLLGIYKFSEDDFKYEDRSEVYKVLDEMSINEMVCRIKIGIDKNKAKRLES